MIKHNAEADEANCIPEQEAQSRQGIAHNSRDPDMPSVGSASPSVSVPEGIFATSSSS